MVKSNRPVPVGRDLLSRPVGMTMLQFSLPTLGSSILQTLNGSVNSIWVGHILGEDALAATINGNMVSFLLMAFAYGTGMAATIMVGKAIGAGNVRRARRVMGTAFGAFSLLSLVVAALGWAATPQILYLLGTPHGAATLAERYLRLCFLGVPFSLLVTLLMMGLRGSGDALSPLRFTLLSVILDVVLNPILILGLGPVPAMGIAGSALSSVFANLAALVAMLAFIYARDLPIRLRRRELRFLRPNSVLLSEIIRKGLPMGMQMIVMTIAAMSVLGLVNREGVLDTAAYSIVQQLWSYMQMPAMAVAAGVSAMTAQAIGAKDHGRVREVTRVGAIVGLSMTLVMIGLILAFDAPLVAIFVGAGSPAAPIASHILWIASWGFAFFALTSVIFANLRAHGVVIWPLMVVTIAMFPLRLGFVFGAYSAIGADALWLSVPVGQFSTWAMATALFLLLARRRRVVEGRGSLAGTTV